MRGTQAVKKILFYGDSNTYGYDPRGFMGMRYPEELRWTTKVQDHFRNEYEIIEEGQNGRCLPVLPREEGFLKAMTGGLSADDALVVMLGTNDILLTARPDADVAIGKMDRLLTWFEKNNSPFSTIIVGPVPISNAAQELRIYYEESLRMNAGFRELCKRRNVSFFDAAEWDIPLAFDGVHFSEEGCRSFATHMIEAVSVMSQRIGTIRHKRQEK